MTPGIHILEFRFGATVPAAVLVEATVSNMPSPIRCSMSNERMRAGTSADSAERYRTLKNSIPFKRSDTRSLAPAISALRLKNATRLRRIARHRHAKQHRCVFYWLLAKPSRALCNHIAAIVALLFDTDYYGPNSHCALLTTCDVRATPCNVRAHGNTARVKHGVCL